MRVSHRRRASTSCGWCPADVGGSEESRPSAASSAWRRRPRRADLRVPLFEPLAAAHPELVAFPLLRRAPALGWSAAGRIVVEATWLAARTRDADLVHHAGETSRWSGHPVVVTLHDLQPLVCGRRRAAPSRTRRPEAGLPGRLPRSRRGVRRVTTPGVRPRRRGRPFSTSSRPNAAVVLAPPPVVVPPAGSGVPLDELKVDRYDLDGPLVHVPGDHVPAQGPPHVGPRLRPGAPREAPGPPAWC